MAEIKFIRNENHTVFVERRMVVLTTDWEGNEVVTEEQLREYLREGTTGDDDIDNICHDLVLEAETIELDEDWWSDRKGCTEYEYEVLDD